MVNCVINRIFRLPIIFIVKCTYNNRGFIMTLKISGKLITPTGTPAANALIRFSAISSTENAAGEIISGVSSMSFTSADGSYDIDLQFGYYQLSTLISTDDFITHGNVNINSETKASDLEDLMTLIGLDVNLTDELIKRFEELLFRAESAAENAEKSAYDAQSSESNVESNKNQVQQWYDYFALNYPKFATDYADFAIKYPDFIVKYNETVTNASNANKDAASAASSNTEAQYWAKEAEKRAQQIFVSGGVFDPSTGSEYPDVAGILRDTAYIVSMPERDKYFKFTSGDLSGKSTANGDVMLYDTPSNKWSLVESGVESSLTKAMADTLYRSINWTPTAADVGAYTTSAADSKMRTDSASQLGLVYLADWVDGIVIGNGALTAKKSVWHNGQFYSVGTDTGFTSNNFDTDLAAGKFVSASILTLNTKFLSKYATFARSLYDRLTMQYVDANDYTVIVAGVIDWSATLQAALDTGRNVEISIGGFSLERTVTYSNQHILGAGCVPLATSGTLLNVAGNFPAFKYDTSKGYTQGGSIKGIFINYGETKPGASHTKKIGIDYGQIGDEAWGSAFETDDVITRGGYYGFFDGTGTYLVTYTNCWAEECFTAFYKQSGTTVSYDTCYSLRCHRAWGVSFTHVVTFTNCAYDGSDTEQYDQAFHLNGCKGVTINGMQHEFSALNRPDTTDFLVENSTGVTINGANFITPDVTTTVGTVYVMEIRNSTATINGLSMGASKSAGAGVYAVIATRGSKVSISASDIAEWAGAPLNASLTADGTSVINYESMAIAGLISGDCRENGSFGSAEFTLSGLSIPAQTQVTVGQKSIAGLKITDYILSNSTFDTAGAVISAVWDGDGIVKLSLYNPRPVALTLSGDIKIKTLRFS